MCHVRERYLLDIGQRFFGPLQKNAGEYEIKEFRDSSRNSSNIHDFVIQRRNVRSGYSNPTAFRAPESDEHDTNFFRKM